MVHQPGTPMAVTRGNGLSDRLESWLTSFKFSTVILVLGGMCSSIRFLSCCWFEGIGCSSCGETERELDVCGKCEEDDIV